MPALFAYLEAGAVRLLDRFVDPSQRTFWGYLLIAVLLAAVVRGPLWFGAQRSGLGRRLGGYLRHPSVHGDLLLLVLKSLLGVSLWAPALLSGHALARSLVAAMPASAPLPGRLPDTSALVVGLVYAAVHFVLNDATRYLLHRALHRVPALWALHRVHHTAERLTPLTLYRAHPGESLLMGLRGIVVTAVVAAGFYVVWGPSVSPATLLGVNALGVLFSAVGSNLRHSGIWLSYGPRVEGWLVSPAQHQLHHSAAPAHADKNFGTWLAIWDRLGGTLMRAGTPQPLRFGLPGQGPGAHGVFALLLQPLAGFLAAALRPMRWRWAAMALAVLWVWPAASADPAGPVPTATAAAEAPVFIDDDWEDSPAADAPDPAAPDTAAAPDLRTDTISILGRPEALPRVAGSAQVLSKEDLERFAHDDVHRVLKRAPGVYLRGEDGYGLRPNIGLRGANSDRSAKVTLMEDGVLLAPAPYAAPAAYYFPLMARIVGVEVFKGPSAIRHGPNTIGGALNLKTRAVPHQNGGRLRLAYGMNRFQRMQGHYALRGGRWGLLVEGARVGTQGFKALDGGGETGFDRNEITLRGQYHSDPSADAYQQLDVFLGYADELSYETYLGLSDGDFAATPNRRYAASQLGRMDWHRLAGRVRYGLTVGEHFSADVVVYRHDLSRAWRKLNRFRGGPSLRSILDRPSAGQNQLYYGLLTGAENSVSPEQALLIGTNDRSFVSQGVAASATLRGATGPVAHVLTAGVRVHNDHIERDHTEAPHQMLRGRLAPTGEGVETVLRNRGEATAVAAFVSEQATWGATSVTPGLRVEAIRTSFVDRLDGRSDQRTDVTVLPGIGAHHQLTPSLGVLLGVHRGFSPVAPGQSDSVRPEESTNYELGARLAEQGHSFELVGFFNDYQNITGQCTISGGCADAVLGEQYNGGAVWVYGLEAQWKGRRRGPGRWTWLGEASYTLTRSSFRSSFYSSFPQFGAVEEGDALPYVPVHQATVVAGAGWNERVSGNASFSYLGTMRDVAGQGEIPSEEEVPSHWVVDLNFAYALTPGTRIALELRNLLNRRFIVSRRPFGARPGRPFHALLALEAAL